MHNWDIMKVRRLLWNFATLFVFISPRVAYSKIKPRAYQRNELLYTLLSNFSVIGKFIKRAFPSSSLKDLLKTEEVNLSPADFYKLFTVVRLSLLNSPN